METWNENSSSIFVDYGEMFTPRRTEIAEIMLQLIPIRHEKPFLVVDIGCGTGWLLEAVLQHFPSATAIGLDGSPVMLGRATERLSRFGNRVSLRAFRLENNDWVNNLSDVTCFLSTLAIHHLYGHQKHRLFVSLKERLINGGGLLITDLIMPTSAIERRYLSTSWDAAVRSQSLAIHGDLSGFRRFQSEEWNYFTFPDDVVDHPSSLLDQLNWLKGAGYSGVDVFWMLAGHAIFGGYKGTTESE